MIAPVASGMIKKVYIKSQQVMKPGQEVQIRLTPSVLALDGEREVEIRTGQRGTVRLAQKGPRVVDVHRTMASAMQRQILVLE